MTEPALPVTTIATSASGGPAFRRGGNATCALASWRQDLRAVGRVQPSEWRAEFADLPPLLPGPATRLLVGDFNATLDHQPLRALLDTYYRDAAERSIAVGILCADIAIILVMSRTTIDLDDEKGAAAARELGTTSKVETVNAALAYVATGRQRAEAFDDPLIWGSPDLADPGSVPRPGDDPRRSLPG